MKFGNKPETIIYKTSKLKKVTNHVLLGTRLDVISETETAYEIDARGRGRSGWVRKSDVRDTPILKIFFVDVGQGDGCLIESIEGVMVIDGGPNKNFYKYLLRRYSKILKEENEVKIKAMIISHPDWDHFNGLKFILEDKRFKIDYIYHTGIIRYATVPNNMNSRIGRISEKTINGKKKEIVSDTFSSLDDAQDLIDEGLLMTSFHQFWEAAIVAKSEGRLKGSKNINVHKTNIVGYNKSNSDLKLEVLGPVPVKKTGKIEYVGFPDPKKLTNQSLSESHTINGHSIIIKLTFGKHSILLGGDLNIPSQLHLIEYYGTENPFRVDVAKSCHHGSSDFLVDYLKLVKPQVNVVSSGDNKSYDHPMADAVGASCKHSRGNFPLFFSTEIGRAYSNSYTHYGLVNLRTNGLQLVMAQMKEQHKGKNDVWDSYTVPWKGKYHKKIKEYRNNE